MLSLRMLRLFMSLWLILLADPLLQKKDAPTETASITESSKYFLEQGITHLQQARYEQAITSLRRALELDPTLITAQYDLGVAYFSFGNLEEARRAFTNVRHQNSGHRFAVYFLARLDLVQGNLDAAISGFKLLGEKPVADELYYLGSTFFKKEDFRQAVRYLEKALAFGPADYRIHLLLGHTYRKLNRVDDASKAYALSEQHRNTYRQKSREILECNTALNSQTQESAVQQCRQLLDGVDPTKLVSLGVLLAERKLYDLALPPLDRAAQLDPENFEPHFNLGLTYFRMKKYQEARRPLERALALRPESYDAVALLGSSLFALGLDYAAVEHLRHAYQLRPVDEKIKSILFEQLKIIAQHLLAKKDYKEAISYFKEALTIKPEAAEIQTLLAQASSALEDRESPRHQGTKKSN